MSSSLRDQLLDECEAMAKFALSSGKKIPSAVAQTLGAAASQKSHDGEPVEGTGGSSISGSAFGGDASAEQLARIHAHLSEIVAPATPRSIIALRSSAQGAALGPLGSVRLLRRMMYAAGLSFLLAVVPLGLSGVPAIQGIFAPLLVLQFTIVAAAGLGASFFALFKANRYVVNNTFDPNYEPTYWVRFALGLIAGTILGTFVEVGQFAKPTLAALGGFSADAVQRILSRLVDAVSSLVRGETRDLLAAQEQALRADLTEKSAEFRLGIATDLVGLQGELRDAGLRDDKRKDLDSKIQKLIDHLFRRDGADENARRGAVTSAQSCPKCGATPRSTDATFCQQCGTPLNSPPASAVNDPASVS